MIRCDIASVDYLFVYLFIYLFIYLFMYLILFIYLFIYVFIYFICLISLFIYYCLFVYLLIYFLSLFIYLFINFVYCLFIELKFSSASSGDFIYLIRVAFLYCVYLFHSPSLCWIIGPVPLDDHHDQLPASDSVHDHSSVCQDCGDPREGGVADGRSGQSAVPVHVPARVSEGGHAAHFPRGPMQGYWRH
jgi:hypothetical protein